MTTRKQTSFKEIFLKKTFLELLETFGVEKRDAKRAWDELATSYNEEHRHYHRLSHLAQMLDNLLIVKPMINDWEATLFALFYHDSIYQPWIEDNELKSADFAERSLRAFGISEGLITKVKIFILATITHRLNNTKDSDLAYFLDADLSILGQPSHIYQRYVETIRKEYHHYCDEDFNKGRIAVLQHFLQEDELFKTSWFKEEYEESARENIKKELTSYTKNL